MDPSLKSIRMRGFHGPELGLVEGSGVVVKILGRFLGLSVLQNSSATKYLRSKTFKPRPHATYIPLARVGVLRWG